jgi:hypothetical protein
VIKPSKQEQIEALNSGAIRDLALKHVKMELVERNGRKELRIPYENIIDVTRLDIKNYLKSHYDIETLIPPQPKEGLFAQREVKGFTLYYQDYGHITQSEFVETEDHLWDIYVDNIIRTEGHGLNFD